MEGAGGVSGAPEGQAAAGLNLHQALENPAGSEPLDCPKWWNRLSGRIPPPASLLTEELLWDVPCLAPGPDTDFWVGTDPELLFISRGGGSALPLAAAEPVLMPKA